MKSSWKDKLFLGSFSEQADRLLTDNFKAIVAELQAINQRLLSSETNINVLKEDHQIYKIRNQREKTDIKRLLAQLDKRKSAASSGVSFEQISQQVRETIRQQVKGLASTKQLNDSKTQILKKLQVVIQRQEFDKETDQLARDQRNVEDDIHKLKAQLKQLDHAQEKVNLRFQQFQNNSVEMAQDIARAARQSPQFNELVKSVERLKQDLGTVSRKKIAMHELQKFQGMILDSMNHLASKLIQKCADRNQTKSYLLLLQSKFNSIISSGIQVQQDIKHPMLTAQAMKCVTCSANIGQFQGNLHKYRPWSVFPAKPVPIQGKRQPSKQFQTHVQSALKKKGQIVQLNPEGLMKSPYDMARQESSPSISPKKAKKESRRPISKSDIARGFGKQRQLVVISNYYRQKHKGVKNMS